VDGPLIDIGINLTNPGFDADRDAVIGAAAAAGVTGLIVTGTSAAVSRDALTLARSRPGALWSTAGVHPHQAAEWSDEVRAEVTRLLAQPEVVAVGECGLDFFRDLAPRAAQEHAFHAQLELAAETRKPVFLHQREAHARFLAMLREHAIGHGVAHCFTDGPVEAAACLAHGLHLGITGWLCDERRGDALREAVRIAPRERLLVETDAPYLIPRDLPVAQRGSRRVHRNEPRWLPHIVATLAALRDEDPRDVADYTRANAVRLFGLAPAG
jgi:TatD DNase family protein